MQCGHLLKTYHNILLVVLHFFALFLMLYIDLFGVTISVIIMIEQSLVILVAGTATESDLKDLLNELEIMTAVGKHPNLVNLIGACSIGGKEHLPTMNDKLKTKQLFAGSS